MIRSLSQWWGLEEGLLTTSEAEGEWALGLEPSRRGYERWGCSYHGMAGRWGNGVVAGGMWLALFSGPGLLLVPFGIVPGIPGFLCWVVRGLILVCWGLEWIQGGSVVGGGNTFVHLQRSDGSSPGVYK